VPGRSFAGVVEEVGSDVGTRFRPGDAVFGLQDLRKSGALAELVVVNRHLLTHAPINPQLSVEQVALLPCAGVPALQTMRAL